MDGVRSPKLGLPLLAVLLAAGPVQAQIVTDGSVGPKVSLRGGEIEIGAKLGSRRGDNLFHSFEKFGIATGQTATFTGPGEIKNVISRVTGGEVSNIDGTLASRVGQADLYFLNPAGVMFGPNATLDVPGSLHVSTAHELRFADGARFSALDKTGSGLTVAAPEAFGFLDRPPGRIAVDQSELRLTPGKTFSLVGGDLLIDGGRTGSVGAADGVVQLVSAAAPGAVRIADAATTVGQRGEVRVTQSEDRSKRVLGAVDVSGRNGGGTISIRGGRVAIDGAWIFADNYGSPDSAGGIDVQADALLIRDGLMTADSLASGNAGRVKINADALELRDGGQILSSAYRSGNAGQVTVTADRELELRDGGRIASETWGRGNAGQVAVSADRVLVTGSQGGLLSQIRSSAGIGSTGQAGTVTVTARELELHGGYITSSTFGSGNAGQVAVSADRVLVTGSQGGLLSQISSSADIGSTGNAGQVTVTADRELELRDGGYITSTTSGSGNAGQVAVSADRVLVTGSQGILLSQISSSAGTGLTGHAGTVAVTARELELHGGYITSTTSGSGNAGQVTVTADRVLATGSQGSLLSLISSSAGIGSTGQAGQVTVTADRELELRDGGYITSTTFGSGNAGQVAVTADRVLLTGSQGGLFSVISSSAGISAGIGSTGQAGQVTVTADRELELHGGGQITSGTFGSGNAGRVAVSADRLLVADGLISSSTEATGTAGTVAVTARELELRDGGQITSGTWGRGDAGQVAVTADRLLVTGVDAAGYPSLISSGTEPGATGAGGVVNIRAQSIVLRDRGAVATESDGTGPGGPLSITAADTLRLDKAAIRARTASARGGDVTVAVGRLFDLRNSAVTTSVAGGTGSGGDINVGSPLMVLNNSRIEANAKQGAGGNITIRAGQLIRTPNSVIQASSAQSISGNITITARNTDVTGSLVVLPETLFDASSQLREACAARGGRPASSFNAGGRGGLPSDPGAPLAASPFGQPLEQQTAPGSLMALTPRSPQAVKPITVSEIPQPVIGSPRLTCRGQ